MGEVFHALGQWALGLGTLLLGLTAAALVLALLVQLREVLMFVLIVGAFLAAVTFGIWEFGGFVAKAVP